MGNKRGNPAWYRGMPSANPKGRPKGQNSLAVFDRDPDWFFIRHLRWERFCLYYFSNVRKGAEAARRAGYSTKSARFIASRLLKKDVIRARLNELVELTRYRPIPIRPGFMIIRCPHCAKAFTVTGLGGH